MTPPEIADGLYRVKEAHYKFCSGHDGAACPLLSQFRELVELPLTLERERAKNQERAHDLWKRRSLSCIGNPLASPNL